MNQKAVVRASKPALIAGIIVTAAFLLMGIFFFGLLAYEGSVVGMAFMGFWITMVLVIMGIYIYNLKNYKNMDKNIAGEIVLPDTIQTGEPDFDEKLRRIEDLHKSGLITEDEYRKKRSEVMDKKW
ncbi:MAG: SHOCT domain-containing protein [Nitrospirae bacterium]|nr:SHOCT domain-containing protein [Nitrospirota bacterium]